MEISTVINIVQWSFSMLVFPAWWFVIKLWNNHYLLVKEVNANKEKIAEQEALRKENENKREEREARREQFEKTLSESILTQGKDIEFIKDQLKKIS